MKEKLKRWSICLLVVFVIGILGCVALIVKNAVLGSSLIIVWSILVYCLLALIKKKREELELLESETKEEETE